MSQSRQMPNYCIPHPIKCPSPSASNICHCNCSVPSCGTLCLQQNEKGKAHPQAAERQGFGYLQSGLTQATTVLPPGQLVNAVTRHLTNTVSIGSVGFGTQKNTWALTAPQGFYILLLFYLKLSSPFNLQSGTRAGAQDPVALGADSLPTSSCCLWNTV
jgi:hypothetical protein